MWELWVKADKNNLENISEIQKLQWDGQWLIKFWVFVSGGAMPVCDTVSVEWKNTVSLFCKPHLLFVTYNFVDCKFFALLDMENEQNDNKWPITYNQNSKQEFSLHFAILNIFLLFERYPRKKRMILFRFWWPPNQSIEVFDCQCILLNQSEL